MLISKALKFCALRLVYASLIYASLQASSELATVEKQKMNSPKIDDALARVWYAEDSEAAVNEQIK